MTFFLFANHWRRRRVSSFSASDLSRQRKRVLQRYAKPKRLRSSRIPGQVEVGKPRTDTTRDRKSTRLNSSHSQISYAVFCLKKKKKKQKKESTHKKKKTKYQKTTKMEYNEINIVTHVLVLLLEARLHNEKYR